MYDLQPSFSVYNDEKYLDHVLKGETEAEDVKLVGDRVASFGIINFGAMAAGKSKEFTPIRHGINEEISARSIYSFTTSGNNDEITYRLLANDNRGNSAEIYEQRLTNSDMPYEFPPGAIVNPYMTIQITSKYNAVAVVLYWQSVHILHYTEEMD